MKIESDKMIPLDFRVLIDVDPAVWQKNYGIAGEHNVPDDIDGVMRSVVKDAITDYLERTGNLGRVQVPRG